MATILGGERVSIQKQADQQEVFELFQIRHD